jgi:hypothetical protein
VTPDGLRACENNSNCVERFRNQFSAGFLIPKNPLIEAAPLNGSRRIFVTAIARCRMAAGARQEEAAEEALNHKLFM